MDSCLENKIEKKNYELLKFLNALCLKFINSTYCSLVRYFSCLSNLYLNRKNQIKKMVCLLNQLVITFECLI